MIKCHICQKKFTQKDVAVRMILEVVSRKDHDGTDPAYWEDVHDWGLLHIVHLKCAVNALEKGEPFEYGDELSELPLEDMERDLRDMVDPIPFQPLLRIVHGGK